MPHAFLLRQLVFTSIMGAGHRRVRGDVRCDGYTPGKRPAQLCGIATDGQPSAFDFMRKGTTVMELKGTHTFATASPQAVWDALHNSATLKAAASAAESVQWQGDNALAVTGGIGPFKGTLVANVTQQNPPNTMQLSASRAGINGTVNVSLTPQGAGTLLTYDANIEAGGGIGLALGAAKGLIEGQLNGFLDNLDKQIS
jgi:carbon monoxide dehydrogenase subunit G